MTQWTVAGQALLSIGFFRQEYWSGWPFPPPGDLPDPGIEPTSPSSPALAGSFFTADPPGKLCLELLSTHLFSFWLCQVLAATCGIFAELHGLLLCHTGSVVVMQVLSRPVACGILAPQPGIWDLSSWTRDQTCVPCIQAGFLTSGPPRKSLHTSFYG